MPGHDMKIDVTSGNQIEGWVLDEELTDRLFENPGTAANQAASAIQGFLAIMLLRNGFDPTSALQYVQQHTTRIS